jgi:hypothetical protein
MKGAPLRSRVSPASRGRPDKATRRLGLSAVHAAEMAQSS